MIKYVVGNLITAAEEDMLDAIGHQTNCFNAMGAGIAPQIAKAFPNAENEDNKTTRGDRSKLGGITIANHYLSNGEVLSIFNLYGQYTASTENVETDYAALHTAMICMRDYCLPYIDRIGFPKIGCGLAGGDWEKVEAMINSIFDEYEVYVYVLDVEELPEFADFKYYDQLKEELLGEVDDEPSSDISTGWYWFKENPEDFWTPIFINTKSEEIVVGEETYPLEYIKRDAFESCYLFKAELPD